MAATSVSETRHRDPRFSRQEGLVPDVLLDALTRASVFIPGMGAIGSAALMALARTGIGRFVIIDPDTVSIENVAGQVFATTNTLDCSKAEVAADIIRSINPAAIVEIMDITNNIASLKEIMDTVDVVVLGMDSLVGGIACYRAAKLARKPVVDFLYFPTPNVISTLPGEETPEERFDYPTRTCSVEECADYHIATESLLRAVAYGFAANPALLNVSYIADNPFLGRFLRLEGAIPSFAPLTMEVGALMARETLAMIAWSQGLDWPRLGSPAFYIDTYRGCCARASELRLDAMPEGQSIMTRLKEIRDADR
jgi:molybdopterin-synthase adenylyltransferase